MSVIVFVIGCIFCLNAAGLGLASGFSVGNAKDLPGLADSRHLFQAETAYPADAAIRHCNVSGYASESSAGSIY